MSANVPYFVKLEVLTLCKGDNFSFLQNDFNLKIEQKSEWSWVREDNYQIGDTMGTQSLSKGDYYRIITYCNNRGIV